MIYTSLAVLAMSASSVLSSLPRTHLHTRSSQLDHRVSVTLHNSSAIFQDVKVAGRTYTIPAERGITIKAPAGTIVYADGPTGLHRRGDALLEMSSVTDQQKIDIR